MVSEGDPHGVLIREIGNHLIARFARLDQYFASPVLRGPIIRVRHGVPVLHPLAAPASETWLYPAVGAWPCVRNEQIVVHSAIGEPKCCGFS